MRSHARRVHINHQGERLEEGSHHELLNAAGNERGYAALCEAQQLQSIEECGTATIPMSGESNGKQISLPNDNASVGAELDFSESQVKDKAAIHPVVEQKKGEEEKTEDEEDDKDKAPPHNPCEIWAYNKPEFPLFVIGIVLSFISGAAWPVFAYIVTVMLDIFYSCNEITAPLLVDAKDECAVSFALDTFTVNSTAHLYGMCQTYNDMKLRRTSCSSNLANLNTDIGTCKDNITMQVNWWCVGFAIVGIVGSAAEALSVIIFTWMGENLTKRLREDSFKNIVRQNIGWFDEKENSSGSLAFQLSTDASLVQNTKGKRIGKTIDQGFSLFMAVIICFVASWQLTIVMLSSCIVMFIGMSLHAQVRVDLHT